MKKCAGYIRVSKGEMQQGTSIINQKELLYQQAKYNNFELIELYIDTSSGTKGNRPALKKMLKDAEEKKFDIILTKEMSRLSRSVELTYRIKHLCDNYDVGLITLDGAVNTLTGNTLFLGQYACHNEQEVESTSKRIKSILNSRARNGLFNGSLPPYGYACENGLLYIKNDETPNIVKRIFNEYISGKGIDSIARSLSEDGIPTPSMVAQKPNAGVLWHGSTIRQLLTNQCYIGNMEQSKENTISAVSSKRKKNDASNRIIVENTHEGIISKEDFKIVQELLHTKSSYRSHQSTHLFTNVAFCADCGKGMHFKKNSKGYVCGGFNKHNIIACTPHRIREAEMINKILEDINIFINSSPVKRKSIDFKTMLNNKILNLEINIESLEKKISNQETIEFNTYKKYALGELSKNKYEAFSKKISEETTKYKDDLIGYKESLHRLKNASISEVISSLNNTSLTIDSLTPEVLNRFVKRIEISENGDAKIFYRFSAPTISE